MRYKFLLLAAVSLVISSCTQKEAEVKSVRSDVITHDLQSSMSPKQILDSLKKGNERFAAGHSTEIDYTSQIIKSENSQYPSAVILSCLDSRVPVEKIFDLGIGDVFVARVAGNVSNTDIAASIEYACKVVGSKLVLVLGHTNCGAVKSAIDSVELGNITELLAKIRPAVDSLSSFGGSRSSKNKEFVDKVTEENVTLAIQNLTEISTILKDMEDSGQIEITGGLYNLENGKVTFFE